MSDPFINTIYQQTPDFLLQKEFMFNSILQLNARVVLELGTDVGDSTRIFASALGRTEGHLWTIDHLTPKWQQDLMDVFMPLITLITSDSLKVNWNSYIDLLFIDSDHSQVHVTAELEKYGHWIRKGGMILLHDTHHSEFGTGITQAIKDYTTGLGLGWEDRYYPNTSPIDHGLGVIRV